MKYEILYKTSRRARIVKEAFVNGEDLESALVNFQSEYRVHGLNKFYGGDPCILSVKEIFDKEKAIGLKEYFAEQDHVCTGKPPF